MLQCILNQVSAEADAHQGDTDKQHYPQDDFHVLAYRFITQEHDLVYDGSTNGTNDGVHDQDDVGCESHV
ncbi:hypothetical protein [Delftia phage PhiW-14]|uniref:Uncharacterized protein n=1 Tax=Delftia phage PhiW-14 TaxID=665032 RepID=C9DGD2_BPW14|nr:hypothetical protein DP-phiW-14_gp162 [Delftia phage PhiW-14]ACV50183.1 hypothetical protein [Delftia phage PhiW-14]